MPTLLPPLADGTAPDGRSRQIEWEFGDVEAGLAGADEVLDETVFHQSLSHQPLETRTTMAYWQNGKVYVYPSVQSTAQGSSVRWLEWAGVSPNDVVLVNEYHRRGIWQQDQRLSAAGVSDSALAKKAGKPVMMRVTRREENFFGRVADRVSKAG